MTFSHYSGGARAQQQCVGNNRSNCGAGATVPVGIGARASCRAQAMLYRDQLLNNDWWTYNGYIQDSYSRGRLRINGGLRYDWQTSKYLGGCVPNNPMRAGRAAGAVRGRDEHRPGHRQADPVVQQLGAARVGHLRPARQRQDLGARQLLVLLRDEDHAGQRARRPVQPAGADLGQQHQQRRLQHHGRRVLLEGRQPRRVVQVERADRQRRRRAARGST